jgi:hypothetical protein
MLYERHAQPLWASVRLLKLGDGTKISQSHENFTIEFHYRMRNLAVYAKS